MVVRAWWQRGTPKEDAMRKRSEVRAAQQQTIDDAKGQGEPSKPGNFIACPREGCGTRMTAQAAKDNDGECVRCAAKLPGFGGDPVGGSSPDRPAPGSLPVATRSAGAGCLRRSVDLQLCRRARRAGGPPTPSVRRVPAA